jgi:hypothetical protein
MAMADGVVVDAWDVFNAVEVEMVDIGMDKSADSRLCTGRSHVEDETFLLIEDEQSDDRYDAVWL